MAYQHDHLTPRQRLFIAARAQGATVAMAAGAAGVTARTGRRYAASPLVALAICQAQDAALADTVGDLKSGSAAAVAVIYAIMRDGSIAASVRLRAADLWLNHVIRLTELVDLAERVTRLEQAVNT